MRVELIDRSVEDAIQIMRKRSSFFDRAIQPKIKETRLAGKALNAAEVADFIGAHPDLHELAAYTNSLYGSTHYALRSIGGFAKDMPLWLEQHYPAKHFYKSH